LATLLACAGVADEDIPYWQPPSDRTAIEDALAEMASYVADVADRYLTGSSEPPKYLIPCPEAPNTASNERIQPPDRWREEAAAWRAAHPDLVRYPAEVLAEARAAWERKDAEAALAAYDFLHYKLGQNIIRPDSSRYYAARGIVQDQRRRARRYGQAHGPGHEPNNRT